MNIPEKVYWELADYIEKNGGLTTKEIVQGFCCDEFKFKSKEEFLLMMKLIKQSKNTFWGIGPFIHDDDKWYNIRNKKVEQIDKVTETNRELREQVLKLQQELYEMKNNRHTTNFLKN
jgi:hypothetical protein